MWVWGQCQCYRYFQCELCWFDRSTSWIVWSIEWVQPHALSNKSTHQRKNKLVQNRRKRQPTLILVDSESKKCYKNICVFDNLLMHSTYWANAKNKRDILKRENHYKKRDIHFTLFCIFSLILKIKSKTRTGNAEMQRCKISVVQSESKQGKNHIQITND